MSQYEALADSYDRLMADAAHRRRAAFLERFLRGKSVHTVLDLGCGTGTIACMLAQRGYQVIATDSSEEMLAQAAVKAQELENPPFFLHQEMSRLRLLEPVDAAISTLDSLNYLTTERALRQTLGRVCRWLKGGGVFLFDVNTPYKRRRMDGQVYMDETEESFCVWRTFFSQRTQVCTYQVDVFTQLPNGTWERRFEEHRERAWTEEQLRQFLTEAGFGEITITGDLTTHPPKAEEDRWMIQAKKK